MTAPKKQLWVLAGGNGAGKSTFYDNFLAPLGIKFLNADVIAKTINPDNPEKAKDEAGYFASEMRESLLDQGMSFCFETVFSHQPKIDFIAKAKSLNYEIIFVYIHLATSELNEARVDQRFSEGGHSVPTDKIHSRIPRTMQNVATVLPLVDEARLIDNSLSGNNAFQQVAIVKQGKITEVIEPLPEWAEEILKYIPKKE